MALSIIYDPKETLQKIAPQKKIKKLLKSNVSLKKSALAFVDSFNFIDKKAVSRIALKTIKSYEARIDADSVSKDEILKDPKLLINRVQNEVVYQISNEIKTKYAGEYFEWLPSDADEPDPEHQLNYGKIFVIGEMDYEGREFGTDGCKCGMRILVNETELKLE